MRLLNGSAGESLGFSESEAALAFPEVVAHLGRMRAMSWQGNYYKARICDSEADLSTLYHFDDQEGDFGFYRSQIAAPDIWPIAVLVDLEVPRSMRCHGLGTTAVLEFLSAARANGARLAFLRVGWTGGLPERDKTVSWYQRAGWHLLKNPSVPGFEVPFMYHVL